MMLAPTRFFIPACLALFAILILQACSAPKKVRLVARVGTLAIDGDLGAHSKGRDVGGKVSVGKLGLDDDDDEIRVLPRLDLDWEKLHLSIEGFTADYSGSGITTDDLAAGGIIIPDGVSLRSSLDAWLLRGTLVYDIFAREHFRFGLGGGAGVVHYEVGLDPSAGSRKLSFDDTLPFPYLSAFITVPIANFEFSALVSGFSLEISDYDFTFVDVDPIVSYLLYAPNDKLALRLAGGYRFLLVDYEFDDEYGRILTDLTFRGPHAGLMFDYTF
jgi:hypothetical protein